MTQRKPPGATWEAWTERLIREGIERGEFDDLPGEGQPLAGLDEARDELWWVREKLRREELEDVLSQLTHRERKVLELRFGLRGEEPRTLEEVGQRFGVTRERIRQIEAKALRKLKHPSRSRKMRSFLDQ